VPRTGSLIILDPFSAELENANAVVFAQSGAGKSYACKVQALRSLACGIAVAIVDPEDEYRRLCQMVGGQFVRLSPSSTQRLNPFDLLVTATSTSSSLTGALRREEANGGNRGEEEGDWDPLAGRFRPCTPCSI
jgi:type IV secretory pathway VirB4 component